MDTPNARETVHVNDEVDDNKLDEEKSECQESYLLSLPVELLVYILSFIHTARDIVKLRYVSKRLRAATEAPSLWDEFVWPLYDPREECSVTSVLKDCGEYIKRCTFPNHVPQCKLLKLVSHCSNVVQLSLPAVTEFGLDELKQALGPMNSLEKLEVGLGNRHYYIEPLLLIEGLKELTIHVNENDLCKLGISEWMRRGYVPAHLVLKAKRVNQEEKDYLQSLFATRYAPPKEYLSCFKLYYDFQVPLNLFPNIPEFQLEFGQFAISPLVQASRYGILSLNVYSDVLLLTSCIQYGKPIYKAAVTTFSGKMNGFVGNLNCVTEFSFNMADSVHSGHLEQLALACPNLQRLDLKGCSDCLKSLRGLRMIAHCCKQLCGLNLKSIPIREVENCLELWEILGSTRLTHLYMEVCTFYPSDNAGTDKKLDRLFKQFSCLQALQLYSDDGMCLNCNKSKVDWSLLSNFPSLRYCRLHSNDRSAVESIANACNELVCLYCYCIRLVLTSICHLKLEQLFINSLFTAIPNSFLDSISAHGQLVHVIMDVYSVTAEGVVCLILNSPGLLTLIISTGKHILNEQGVRFHAKDIKAVVKKTFLHRKLFSVGDFRFLCYGSCDIDSFLYDTDLLPLWYT